ncbi:GNAT family N-acetyltransferase [Chitiniphilus shinanonensis]|uniref:GNAT family N-acetyltransferase n=1 Tax=Chitiniphilus shinanonensis TaxID=553088 RepID=UPI0030576F3A
MSFFKSVFGGSGGSGKPRSSQIEPPGTEMKVFHEQPTRLGQRGTLDYAHGSATFDHNAHDLTVHSIQSEQPGGGSKLMHRIAQDAQELGKPFIRTTLTAPSAHGFYHKMGMLPSQATKTAAENRWNQSFGGQVSPFAGGGTGKLNPDALAAFDLRLKTSRSQWEAPTATVLQNSGRRN